MGSLPALRIGFVRTVVAVATVAWMPPLWAAPFDPNGQGWESCSKLRDIAIEELGANRVDVTDEIDYEKLGPTDGILLLHPQGAYDLDELSAFMRGGGRVAVVDDFGDGDRLLDRFRIQRGPAPSNPLEMLHGNTQLPVAVPASGHPIVADVGKVILNHPTTVRHPDLSSLLRIPLGGGDAGPDVALAGQVGEGRLVAMGDPSALIDSMIRFPGNRAVAKNLVVYLLEGAGEHKREAKLHILHDKFKERGTLGGGLRGSLRDRFRGLLGALDSVRKGGFEKTAARIVALGIALGAAIWVTLRAGSRQKIPRARYAAEDPDAARVGFAEKDPRIEPLFAKKRWFAREPLPTTKGMQVLLDGIEAAIAAREDLVGKDRAAALTVLAKEAKLEDKQVKRAAQAYERLRRAAAGVGGEAGFRVSATEVSLLGRVLAPVAGSLRTARS